MLPVIVGCIDFKAEIVLVGAHMHMVVATAWERVDLAVQGSQKAAQVL